MPFYRNFFKHLLQKTACGSVLDPSPKRHPLLLAASFGNRSLQHAWWLTASLVIRFAKVIRNQLWNCVEQDAAFGTKPVPSTARSRWVTTSVRWKNQDLVNSRKR